MLEEPGIFLGTAMLVGILLFFVVKSAVKSDIIESILFKGRENENCKKQDDEKSNCGK